MLNSDLDPVAGSSLTIVVTSSYIPSHPSKIIISKTLDSLLKLGLGNEVPLVIVQDALPITQRNDQRARDYQAYLESLEEFKDRWPNLEIVALPKWGHINGGLQHAMSWVKTEYVLVVQHDLEFVRAIDVLSLLAALENHPEVKHIRFNKKLETAVDWDAEYEYRNRIQSRRDFLKAVSITDRENIHRLVRTLAWSDNNYLCRKSYLTETVFALTGKMRIAPEHALNPLGSPNHHRILGTYIYGGIDEPPIISHLDGRNTPPIDPTRQLADTAPWHHSLTKHLADARLRAEARIRMWGLRLKHRKVEPSDD